MKSWARFLEIAYPEALAAEERDRFVIWQLSRRVGLRSGFVLYRLGIPANVVSTLRFLMAVAGIALLYTATHGEKILPFVGVLLLSWQVNLDFADGVVARAQGKASAPGQLFDGLANAGSRAVILVLFGVVTGSQWAVIVSAATAYILVTFLPQIDPLLAPDGYRGALRGAVRLAVSVIFMVLALPWLIALPAVLDLSLETVAYGVVGGYTVLASLRLLDALWQAQHGDGSPPSHEGK